MSPLPVAGRRSPTGRGAAPTTARSSRCGGRDPRRRTTRSPTTWRAAGDVPDVPALADEPRLVGHRLRRRRRRRPRPRATVTCVVRHQRARRAGRRAGGRRGARHRARRPVRRHPARDPGREIGDGRRPPGSGSAARPIPLWTVSTRTSDGDFDRSVVRRRGRRPLAVAGAPAGLGDAAAERRLDPARRLRPRPAAGRDAVRGPPRPPGDGARP